ncbi:hypothetical protein [Microbacterium trichothecenolyticum]|uniref:hypothetical protein n=1 Tax=Microbacterium trichothecenolyticum TaxID=69370 RepID=UPI00358F3EE2
MSSKKQVDTDYDPEGISLPAQRLACEKKAEQMGLQIVDEYVDAGFSGTDVAGHPFSTVLRSPTRAAAMNPGLTRSWSQYRSTASSTRAICMYGASQSLS